MLAIFMLRPQPEPARPQRKFALEEILIAEGSDWNWWYGPEHHSANDREFDELYRKHLSNVYQALGASRPITWRSRSPAEPSGLLCAANGLHPSAHYGTAHPLFRVDGRRDLYRGSPRRFHARQAVPAGLVYAGIDEENVYGRLDFVGDAVPATQFDLVLNVESGAGDTQLQRRSGSMCVWIWAKFGIGR